MWILMVCFFSSFGKDNLVCLEVKRVARWITPVPGGVGPVTVACLISNLLKLAQQRKQ
jgi:5,10-methylene-tetrahydrofolate dehydrogenase/methenyl tetrahydrofolate cyclohydrolase